MMHKVLFYFLMIFLSSGFTFAEQFKIDQELLGDLRSQRYLLDRSVKDVDNVSKQIAVAKADKRSAESSIRRLGAESEKNKNKLEKLQEFDRDNPGTITREKMRAAEEQNRESYSKLQKARQRKSNAEIKLNELEVEASVKNAEFLRLKKSFERDVGRVVDTQLQIRLRELRQKKKVTVTEKVACGDDSIPVCKERSKKAAELKASERGSVVFVNSLTEVKNFKLSKDELRSEVQAILSNKIFSNQHLVGETEYETTITANVEPAIGRKLREQMEGSIQAQVYNVVGGSRDLSGVQTSPISDSDYEEPAPVRANKPAREIEDAPKEFVEKEPVAPKRESPARSAPRKNIRPTFTF